MGLSSEGFANLGRENRSASDLGLESLKDWSAQGEQTLHPAPFNAGFRAAASGSQGSRSAACFAASASRSTIFANSWKRSSVFPYWPEAYRA
jgi:hypothetical protein